MPSTKIVQQIGRYKIVEEIGRGASGVVYRALDPAIFGRTIAIKVIQLTMASSPAEARQLGGRLVLEAKAVALLLHRNIINLYDAEQEDGAVQIFMEFVNGPSLKTMLSGRNLPNSTALLDFFRQVADGLDYAHRSGIVHRDVKPANLMLHDEIGTGERLAKITDFGVANFASHPTTHQGLRGTPSYMAPEQVEGKPISGRTDQFALALVAYEVLTGRKAFSAQHLSTLFFRIIREEPQPAHHLNPSLSPLISRILSKGLSKDPALRYESCTAFVTALIESLNANPQWVVAAPSEAPPESEAEVISDETLDAALHPVSRAAFASAAAASSAVFAEQPIERAGLRYELPALNRRNRGGENEEDGQGLALWRKVGIAIVLCAMAAAGYFMYERFLSQQLAVGTKGVATSPPTAAATNTSPMESPSASPPAATANIAKRSPMPSKGVSPPVALGGSAAAGSSQAEQQRARMRAAQRAAQTAPITPRGPTNVEFSTNPASARIVVDGDESQSCTTPCALPLPAGRHTFTVALSGYAEAKRILQVPDDSTAFIGLTPEVGVVQIASLPSGSTIYIDGRMQGQTPATLRIKAGRHQVRLVSGSKYHEETIDVNADSVQSFTFRWAP